MRIFIYLILLLIIGGCKSNNLKVNYDEWQTLNRSEVFDKANVLDTINASIAKISLIELTKIRNRYFEEFIDSLNIIDNTNNKLIVVESFSRKKKYSLIVKEFDSNKNYQLKIFGDIKKSISQNMDSMKFDRVYDYICRDSLGRYTKVAQIDYLEIYSELQIEDGLLTPKRSCSYLTFSEP